MQKWITPFILLLIFTSCETQTPPHSGFIQPPHVSGQPGQGCTQEAQICPDGSSVGRVAPDCAFAPCPSLPAPERVVFDTSDGVLLTGTLYPAGNKAVLLLHMLGKNRQSWERFATALQGAGYTVLAIDLRGHGESVLKNDHRIQYTAFSDREYNDMIHDLEASVAYLKNKTISIVGASIGANLALKYAAHDPLIQKIILLSPGLEYHGVNIEQDNLMYTGKVLMVASQDDLYSAESSQELAQKSRGDAKLQMYPAAGHGTNMLTTQPELTGFLIDWLNTS